MSTLAIDRLARAIVLACEASGARNGFALKWLSENFNGPTPAAAATVLRTRMPELNARLEPYGWTVLTYDRPRHQYGERVPAMFSVAPL
jgi:hypothetical protein